MIARRSRLTLRLAAMIGAALTAVAAPALAGQLVILRLAPYSGPQITLGDLFDEAGAASSVVIGNGAPLGETAVLDAVAVQRMARAHGLDWDNPNAIQRILVRSGEPRKVATVQALTYTHSLMSGDVIQPQDIGYAKIPSYATPADAPRDPDAVIGMMVKHPVREGAVVSEQDIAAVQVIKRDDVVEVAYNSDGISLVLQGKAMASATVGQPLSILNPVSKKVIEAVAVGPDQAVVGPDAERLRDPAYAIRSRFTALR